MAKGFSRNNPLDTLSGKAETSKPKKTEAQENLSDEETTEAAVDPKKQTKAKSKGEAKKDIEPQPKRKPGRPKVKSEVTKTINIAIPVSVLNKINVAKVCYNGNLTEYINRVIEKDLEENYKKYEKIAKQLNEF